MGLPEHYNSIQLDVFSLMPDHFHAILIINEPGKELCQPVDLSEIFRAFKSFSSREVNIKQGTSGKPVWQRNYFDRIIRNQQEYEEIKRYILDNPYRKS